MGDLYRVLCQMYRDTGVAIRMTAKYYGVTEQEVEDTIND